MTSAEILTELRYYHKWSQEAVALAYGIDKKTYQRWEKGGVQPAFNKVVDFISKVYNLTMVDVYVLTTPATARATS